MLSFCFFSFHFIHLSGADDFNANVNLPMADFSGAIGVLPETQHTD